ncbi:MAG: potassium channel protein [Gemmatimonadetes bacterium]|nr:potassium channel protein [Gemmatimonadota bacterium]
MVARGSGHRGAVTGGTELHADRQLRSEIRAVRQRLALPIALLGLTMLAGAVGYRLIGGPDVSLLDALYMTVNAVTTTGFREAVDVSRSVAGRVFTMGLLFVGATVGVYSISAVTAFIVEGDLTEGFRRRRMARTIEAMTDHYIICGVGQAGLAVLQELQSTKRQVVVIEADEGNAERLSDEYPEVPILRGDFTDDEVLQRGGITRAAGIVLCVDSDKDSLVGTVMARQLNPAIRIVARATDNRAITRLRSAGADAVVSPGLIGGMRLASELVRPSVVSFLDRMLRATDQSMRIEEVDVPEGSPLAGHTIHELDTRQFANLLVLAVMTPDQKTIYNPPHEMRVSPGSTLIVMAEAHGVSSLQRAFTPAIGSRPVSSS